MNRAILLRQLFFSIGRLRPVPLRAGRMCLAVAFIASMLAACTGLPIGDCPLPLRPSESAPIVQESSTKEVKQESSINEIAREYSIDEIAEELGSVVSLLKDRKRKLVILEEAIKGPKGPPQPRVVFPYTADFGGANDLLVSRDGRRVSFVVAGAGDSRRRQFDVGDLSVGPGGMDLAAPRTTGLSRLQWRSGAMPLFDGKPMFADIQMSSGASFPRPLTSDSLAIAPDGDRFVIGTEEMILTNHVAAFDRCGSSLWSTYKRPLDFRTMRAVNTIRAVNWTPDGRFVIVAYGDGEIQWLRSEDGTILLTLFVAEDGKRWAAWARGGFFAASDGMEDYIQYRFTAVLHKMPTDVTSQQIYKKFYRPDLIARALDEDDAPWRAALAENGDATQVITSAPPPKIKILGPAEQTVNRRNFDLEVEVSDQGGGVGDLLVFVNGKRVAITDGRAAGLRGPNIRRIPLQGIQGTNVVDVRATNTKQSAESKPALVTVHVDDPLTRPPSLYVVAVGIDKYQDPELNLRFAVADARRVAETLRERGRGLFAERIYTRVLTAPAETTRAAVERSVAEIARKVRPEDVFVLYLAGHGEVIDGRYHFITSDVIYRNQRDVKAASLGHDRIDRMIEHIRAQKSLLVLDTCYAGAVLTPKAAGQGAIDALAKASGAVAVLASSSARDIALEGYQGQGVFSYVLNHGLGGDADQHRNGDHDGKVTVFELAGYLEVEVPLLTEKTWHLSQVPNHYLRSPSFPLTSVSQ